MYVITSQHNDLEFFSTFFQKLKHEILKEGKMNL